MPDRTLLPKFVFLDRDGVLNAKLPAHQWVTRPEELILEADAATAIARLNTAGIITILVTNQRGIALGLLTEEDLHSVHARLSYLLAAYGAHLDAIYYCPHHRDACNCRKPFPGLFYQAFADYPDCTAANSLLIGDSLSDIQAGHCLGMQTVFIVGRPDTRDSGAQQAAQLATFRAASLNDFVNRLFDPVFPFSPRPGL